MYLKITAYNERNEIIQTTVYDDLPLADLPSARQEAKRLRDEFPGVSYVQLTDRMSSIIADYPR